MAFYRGTWCGYCNIYLRGLLETRSQLSDANAALIAVSPEAAPVSADNASAVGPTFPVLIDHGGKIAEQFGLAFEMEHAPLDFPGLRQALQFMMDRRQIVDRGTLAPAVTPMVRIPPNGIEMNSWIA